MEPHGLTITVEPDPAPMVLILAATLRRSARDPKLASKMRKARGNVALHSTVDPQCATMRFDNGTVRIVTGVSTDSHVTIGVDVNKMADEHPPKPTVEGAATHLRLALLAAKVLDAPHGSWQEEGAVFLAPLVAIAGAPRGVRVVCTDDNCEQIYGDEGAVEYEIFGSTHALINIFCGNTVFGQDLLDGKVRAVGTLSHLASLTGRSIAVMLGGA
jgi:hypothetical protein